jgi:hypothetical protein
MMWALCNGSWCSMFWRLPMFIGLCVGQFVFLRTKRYSTSMDTLIVKTIEYGLLKTHVHCMKILCIRHRLVFGKRCLENNRWTTVFEETITAENYSDILTHFVALLEENK